MPGLRLLTPAPTMSMSEVVCTDVRVPLHAPVPSAALSAFDRDGCSVCRARDVTEVVEQISSSHVDRQNFAM